MVALTRPVKGRVGEGGLPGFAGDAEGLWEGLRRSFGVVGEGQIGGLEGWKAGLQMAISGGLFGWGQGLISNVQFDKNNPVGVSFEAPIPRGNLPRRKTKSESNNSCSERQCSRKGRNREGPAQGKGICTHGCKIPNFGCKFLIGGGGGRERLVSGKAAGGAAATLPFPGGLCRHWQIMPWRREGQGGIPEHVQLLPACL